MKRISTLISEKSKPEKRGKLITEITLKGIASLLVT